MMDSLKVCTEILGKQVLVGHLLYRSKEPAKFKVKVQEALDKDQLLFDSLMQEYFG